MDWLAGMNNVTKYIEDNLEEPIAYEALSKIVGCSVYEFSRIFSFMAGVSLSEYIRRRRLTRAVFDIQNGSDRIVDVALKYCYESQATFTRAFKELHGTTPLSARKSGVPLKAYPPISFTLTVKGASELSFRMERLDELQLMGVPCQFRIDEGGGTLASLFNSEIRFDELLENQASGNESLEIGEDGMPLLPDGYSMDDAHSISLGREGKGRGMHVKVFSQHDDTETKKDSPLSYVVVALDYAVDGDTVNGFFGFDRHDMRNFDSIPKEGDAPNLANSVHVTTTVIPATNWAVFSFDNDPAEGNVAEAYARILTEWLPESGYRRDETKAHLERYPFGAGGNWGWEIWLPVINLEKLRH